MGWMTVPGLSYTQNSYVERGTGAAPKRNLSAKYCNDDRTDGPSLLSSPTLTNDIETYPRTDIHISITRKSRRSWAGNYPVGLLFLRHLLHFRLFFPFFFDPAKPTCMNYSRGHERAGRGSMWHTTSHGRGLDKAVAHVLVRPGIWVTNYGVGFYSRYSDY